VFRHVVVPIDLSNRNQQVLAAAAEVSDPSESRLTLLHVVEELHGVPSAELREFYDRLRTGAEAHLARTLKAMKRNQRKDRIEIKTGRPAKEIVAYASRSRADLIVMGSHSVDPRRKAPPHPGWGTVSYKVALLCRCPILLVK